MSADANPPVDQPDSFAFSKENAKRAKQIMAKYPERWRRSAVMPLLDLAQRQEGWLSRAAMEHVAGMLDMPPIQVEEVATFYTMYKLRPVGRHHVEVCTNIACWLCGSSEVMKALAAHLGVEVGETTPDGAFSLAEAECLGACVNAPMMQIGDHYYEDLTPDSAVAVVEALARDEQPAPGPQNGRRSSEPLGGPTVLKPAADAKGDA